MAYTSGDIILDDHYNGFVASVNAIWGSGTGGQGYGQTSTVSGVSAGNTITATQWTTLLSRISSAATHQGSSITSISNPTAGSTIAAYAALSGNITTVTNNRFNHAGTGTNTTDTNATTGSWTTQTQHIQTVTFAGGDEARYFFNAGGEIRISFAHVGSTSNYKNSNWAILATHCGTIVMDYTGTSKSGGSGTVNTLASTTGYYDLSTSNTLLFQQYNSTATTYGSTYSSNYIAVYARVSAAHGDGRGNNGNQVIFTINYRDDAADQTSYTKNTYNVLDIVDGTTTTTTTARQPSTSVLTNTWGTPSWGSTNSRT